MCAVESSQLKVCIQFMDLSAHGLFVTYHHHPSLLVLVPPRFIDELESQAVIPKSDVFFKGVFEGTPPFMVKWFKDDIELITGPSCRVRLEKYSSSVELCSVGTVQSGIYSCQVSNEAGTTKSAAQLLVKGWTILFFVHHHHRAFNSIFFLHFSQLFPVFMCLFFALLASRNICVIFRVLCYSSQSCVCVLHPSLLLKCYFMLRIVT